MLKLAHRWKRGSVGNVHPEVGRLLNAELRQAGEEAVPFVRSTDMGQPGLAECVEAMYRRVSSVREAHASKSREGDRAADRRCA